MRIIKGMLSLSLGWVNDTRKQEFEIEIPNDATEAYIEEEIQKEYEEFMWNRVDGGWAIESDEIL